MSFFLGVPLLLAIYLVFKGQELRLLAALSAPEDREVAARQAMIWFYVAIVIASLFIVWVVGEMIGNKNG